MFTKGGDVTRGAVALVRRQAVHGKDRVPGGDHAVALHLGDDGRGGNRNREGVPVDDGIAVADRNQSSWHRPEDSPPPGRAPKGMQHGQPRSMIDVDLVNPGGIDGSDRIRDRMFANANGEFLTALGRKQLGIAQPANAVAGIENDRGRHHRSEQGSAPHFVHSGDQLGSRSPRQLFKFQSATQSSSGGASWRRRERCQ